MNKNPILSDVEDCMDGIDELKIAPKIYVLENCPTDREVVIDGKKILFFSSNNYLGLASNERIKKAIIDSTKIYGFGSGASRLAGGTFDLHLQLEAAIAKFKGEEAAIIMSTGSITNDSVIPALVNIPDFKPGSIIKNKMLGFFGGSEAAIFSDELNHASIVDGCRLAKAEKHIYRHLDMEDLEHKLSRSKARKKIVITDSVFSMDGDVVDIKKIIEIKNKYDALLYVDEAHTTGVMGKNGHGISEEYGVDGIDVKMGTFSKAFGGAGGFIAGNKMLVDYLRYSCRKYIFSTAMPPSNAAGLIEAIKIAEESSHLRENLKLVSNTFREKAKEAGFSTFTSTTQIVPIMIGEESKTMRFSEKLFEKGILAPSVIWPATPRKLGRIRVSFIATHTLEDVDRLIDALIATRSELGD